MNLRKKVPSEEFLGEKTFVKQIVKFSLDDKQKEKLKEISDKNQGSNKAVILDENLEEIKTVSVKSLTGTLKRVSKSPTALVIDGTVTNNMISASEEAGIKVIAAKNFITTDTEIQLLSL